MTEKINAAIELPVEKIEDRIMGLHHEIAEGELGEEKIRFTVDIGFRVFWLSIGDNLYQIDSSDLVEQLIESVAAQREMVTP